MRDTFWWVLLAGLTLSACTNQPLPITQPQTNRAPTLTDFRATPQSGTAALQAAFSWKVSDPNGDAMTCKLDADGDGSFEYTLAACTSAKTQAHVYTAAGVFDAQLRVEDGKGESASAKVTVSVTAPPPDPSGPDVSIARAEWGQSVLKTNLELVSGKPALLRVYVLGDRAGLSAGLSAQVWRGSTFVGNLNMSGPATLPTAEAPGDLSQTFRATLPADWVSAGLEVRLQADPGGQVAERDESNNALTVRPAVGPGTVLHLTFVPVIQPAQTAQPNMPSTDLMEEMFPVRDVQTAVRASFAYGSSVTSSGDSWSKLLEALRALRTADKSGRYYYGVVRTSYSSGVAGIGYVGFPVAAGWDASGSGARILAHEVGHNLGRGHAPCGTVGEGGYPYANGSIGTWGYGVTSGTLYSPSTHKDVMSYCSPQWISDYMYERMQEFLQNNPPQAQSLGAPQDVLLVSGAIRGGRMELNPLQRIRSAPERTSGPYTLRLETAAGATEVAFDTARVEAPHGPDQPPQADWAEEHFAFTVRDPGALRSLEVEGGGRLLFARAAEVRSQAQLAPRASVREQGGAVRLEWDSRAYPFATLAHLGAERTTLGVWLEGGQAALPATGLPAGGKWEVSLSDGVNSARLEVNR